MNCREVVDTLSIGNTQVTAGHRTSIPNALKVVTRRVFIPVQFDGDTRIVE